MFPWSYKVMWDDGRTQEVTIRLGDQARFEAQMNRSIWAIIEAKAWTSYMDLIVIHLALTRMKVEPVQSLDEFIDSVDIEQLQFGDAMGKASGRGASSGRSRRSPPSTATTP